MEKDISIIYEDSHVLGLNKPAGVLVHPADEEDDRFALTDWLLEHYPSIEGVGEGKLRPGIVHRLDKNTSGVLVVAKNDDSYSFLKNQFKNREVKKVYLLLVYGNLEKPSGTIEKPITRSNRGPFKYRAIEKDMDDEGRYAKTDYKVLKQNNSYSLVKASPYTGRTHQIRVHFSSIGSPIVGDRKYSFKRHEPEKDIDRIFLHSYGLEIKNSYSDKVIRLEAPLPDKLNNFLSKNSLDKFKVSW